MKLREPRGSCSSTGYRKSSSSSEMGSCWEETCGESLEGQTYIGEPDGETMVWWRMGSWLVQVRNIGSGALFPIMLPGSTQISWPVSGTTKAGLSIEE